VLKGITSGSERKEMITYLLNKVNLFDKRNKKVKSFSGGMKQRVGIAQALIGSPQLIIVDEPTAGLDPGERNRFHNLLADVGEDVVVILSTHIVDDVRELCNNMAIMNNGRLVYTGSPITVIDELRGQVWRKAIEREQLQEHMDNYRIISNKMVAGKPQIHVLSEINPGEGFVSIEPNLEDVFFNKIHFSETTNV
jgi:ABC-2 type transport system ATP-binding protein